MFRFRDWEGKLKKLVADKEFISSQQFLFVFRDYEDFDESDRPFLTNFRESFGADEDCIFLDPLLVMGLLYCSFKKKVRQYQNFFEISTDS
jgi:hypothetical protein